MRNESGKPETTPHDDDWDDDPDAYDAALDCDHEDADIDILTGRLSCRCGYTEWLSTERLTREAQLQADLAEAWQRECETDEQP